MFSMRASGCSCPGFDSQHSPQKIPVEKIVAVAEVNQQRCWEKIGQRLENADQTNLEKANSKLVLRKEEKAKLD